MRTTNTPWPCLRRAGRRYIPKTSNLWLASLLDDGAKAVPVVVEAIPGRRNPICKVIVFVSDRELRMREFICFR